MVIHFIYFILLFHFYVRQIIGEIETFSAQIIVIFVTLTKIKRYLLSGGSFSRLCAGNYYTVINILHNNLHIRICFPENSNL